MYKNNNIKQVLINKTIVNFWYTNQNWFRISELFLPASIRPEEYNKIWIYPQENTYGVELCTKGYDTLHVYTKKSKRGWKQL